jgi:acetylglutamate synthase
MAIIMRNQTKGKKSDVDFLNQFISDCVKNNIFSIDEIVDFAKNQISEIDSKIIEVEKLKKIRCKLLGVVSSLDKSNKSFQDFSKTLSLFKINNHHICQKILSKVKNESICISSLQFESINTEDVIFCIKQLIDEKVIYSHNQTLSPGEFFQDFERILLQEV